MNTSVLISLGIVFLFVVLLILAFFVFLNKKPKNFEANLNTKLGQANLQAEMQSDSSAQPEQTLPAPAAPAAPPLAPGALKVKGVKAGEDVLIDHQTRGSADIEDIAANKSVLIETRQPPDSPKAPPRP